LVYPDVAQRDLAETAAHDLGALICALTADLNNTHNIT
jgi:hypothetical protein